eukprot:s1_g2080.t1
MFKRLKDIWFDVGVQYLNSEDSRTAKETALADRKDWQQIEDAGRLTARLKRKGMTKTLAETLVADAKSNPSVGVHLLERIIDENELLDVSFLTLGNHLSHGVARVQIRSSSGRVAGYGTGFLVSDRLFLTNNHNLPDKNAAANSLIQFDYRKQPNGVFSHPAEFLLEPDVFFQTHETLDFTLVAVAPRSEAGTALKGRPWMPLSEESGKALVGEYVNILQHPKGEHLQIAFRQSKVTDVLPNVLHYSADTQKGSSGSSVSNDAWELAALHRSGVPKMDSDKNILLTDGSIWNGKRTSADLIRWVANEGTRISRIVAHLDRLTMSAKERSLYLRCFVPSPLGRIGLTESWLTPSELSLIEQRKNTVRAGVSSAHANRQAISDLAAMLIEQARGARPYFDDEKNLSDMRAYYQEVDFNDTNPSALFQAIRELTQDKHTTELSYRTARLRYLYPWVDLRENGRLRNIYSGTPLSATELLVTEFEQYEKTRPGFVAQVQERATAPQWRKGEWDEVEDDSEEENDDELDELSERRAPFNCEHIVPQSWFEARQPMKADLHHLFTCEPDCNSFRGNKRYVDFDPLLDADPQTSLEITRSDCGQTLHDMFEPEQGHGPVARAFLYFLLRYPKTVTARHHTKLRYSLPTLLNWHQIQKPNRYEKHRNAAIFEIQGNRNPLIDLPDIHKFISFEEAIA